MPQDDEGESLGDILRRAQREPYSANDISDDFKATHQKLNKLEHYLIFIGLIVVAIALKVFLW